MKKIALNAKIEAPCCTRQHSKRNVVEFFVSRLVLSATRCITLSLSLIPCRSNLVSMWQNTSAMQELSFGCWGLLTVKVMPKPWATIPMIPSFGRFKVARSLARVSCVLGNWNLTWSIPSWMHTMCPNDLNLDDPRRVQYVSLSRYCAIRCWEYSDAWCCLACK